MIRKFDLNIETMLGHWGIDLAVREIIANAMDEQVLTNSDEIEIYKDELENWHIRDFGRGLHYTHLTQNENSEKIRFEGSIGYFGVGLKDALAVFYRHNIEVEILSKHGRITLSKESKHGFEDIVTLHANVDHYQEDFVGTDFILKGCRDDDIDAAKEKFLKFKNIKHLEDNQSGGIYQSNKAPQGVYINGVLIAEEWEFLFSYNITGDLARRMKKKLNRERTNVGRSAYSENVQKILRLTKCEEVLSQLVKEMKKPQFRKHEVSAWKDIQIRAIKEMNPEGIYVFISEKKISEEYYYSKIDLLKRQGYKMIPIKQETEDNLHRYADNEGNIITTMNIALERYDKSFTYQFVSYEEFSEEEKAVFDTKDEFLELYDSPELKSCVYISETLALDSGNGDVVGIWDPTGRRIIIKRKQLDSREAFLGTLLHEAAHAKTGFSDVNRDFESELTHVIGLLAGKLMAERIVATPASAQSVNEVVAEEENSTNEKSKRKWFSFFK